MRTCARGPALVVGGKVVTYDAFARRVGGIRALLSSEPSECVGICLWDDVDTYAAILAAWFSGKAIVPMSPTAVASRVAAMVQQADVRVLLSSRDVPGALRAAVRVELVATARDAALGPPTALSQEALAYVLFTSGSTGVPKGVPITHAALDAFWTSFTALGLDLDASDRVLQMFDLTFDLSVMSYAVPFAVGACVCTVPAEGPRSMNVLRVLEEQQITVALMVPSTLAHLRPYFAEIALPALRCSLFCGEALHSDLVGEWRRCVPNARILNVYGPTEATIFCMAYECLPDRPPKSKHGVVSIGRAMQDMRVVVDGEGGRRAPAGVMGELLLAGPQLTRGYLDNPAKNAVAFESREGAVYYRTGDLCFEDDEGDCFYCGRLDQQVKVQGYRIELGELEHHVREIAGSPRVAVVACAQTGEPLALHLFLEQFEGSVEALLARLGTSVPSYMMPSRTRVLDTLPLNANGKIDRTALARLALDRI